MKHINLCRATGLLYVDEVPVTQETLKKIKEMIDYNKQIRQFEVDVIIKDNVNESICLFNEEVMKEVDVYMSEHNVTIDMLANNADFN